MSGNVLRAGAVLGAIRGPIQEAASIHMQTIHIIHDNSGHQHIPPPAFPRTAWELESTQLPPYEDCLFMDTMHANYQAGISRCSLQQHPLVPSPVKRVWVRNDDGQLTVEWMRGFPAPDAVPQLLLSKCNHRCKLPECHCMNNGFKMYTPAQVANM